MMEVKEQKTVRVEIRCKTCGSLLCYKVSMASGLVEMKCSKCGKTALVNLALRKRSTPIQYRRARSTYGFLPSIYIAN